MTIKISGLIEVSVASVALAVSNFEQATKLADEKYAQACEAYIADNQNKMFTGMLWWKKPVTDPRKILVSDCDFICGTYNSVDRKLIDLGYATNNEIKLSDRVLFPYKGNIKDTYAELCNLVAACEGAMYINAEQAAFVNNYK